MKNIKKLLVFLGVFLFFVICIANIHFNADSNQNVITNLNLAIKLYDSNGNEIELSQDILDNIKLVNKSSIRYDDDGNVESTGKENKDKTLIDNEIIYNVPISQVEEIDEQYIEILMSIDSYDFYSYQTNNEIPINLSMANEHISTKYYSSISENNSNSILIESIYNELNTYMNDSVLIVEDEELQDLYVVWNVEKETNQVIENENGRTKIVVSTTELVQKTDVISDLIEKKSEDTNCVSDFFEEGIYEVPIKDFESVQDNILFYNKENYGEYSSITINDPQLVYSIGNNGKVIDVNNMENYLLIEYANGTYIRYENVIPCVELNDTVNTDDIIGKSVFNNNINIYVLRNNSSESAYWIFDTFEHPTVGYNLPRMYQSDERWGSQKYGYNTLSGGGCGASAFAMVASGLLETTITPADIKDTLNTMGRDNWYYLKGSGSYYFMFPRIAEKYGIECRDAIGTSESAIKDALNRGEIVIISISHGRVYKGDGHFIVIRGLTEDGKFLINDSAKYFDLDTGYEYSDLKPIGSARSFYMEEKLEIETENNKLNKVNELILE